jgi:hypothetical protein
MIYQNVFGKSMKPLKESVSRVKTESEDFDLTQTMLENFIILEDAFFDITKEHMMATHLSLKEDSIEILQEGFKDFGHAAVEFFKNMIKKFKEFMSNVFMVIRSYFGNFETFIHKYEDKLKTLKPDFSIYGYTYSFTDSVPQLDKIHQLINSYNVEVEEVKKMKKEDLIKERDVYTSSDQMSEIRAYVLGSSSRIDKEYFLETAKQTYRSGSDKEELIKIDNNALQHILDNYKELKTVFKRCASERDKTIMLIENLKDFFSKSASVHYKANNKVMYAHSIEVNSHNNGIQRTGTTEIPYDMGRLEVVNLFYNFKWMQSKELGSICVMAVTEKVNALKEAMKLSEKIIHKAMFNSTETIGPTDKDGGDQ